MKYTIRFEVSTSDHVDVSELLDAAEQAEADLIAHIEALGVMATINSDKTMVCLEVTS